MDDKVAVIRALLIDTGCSQTLSLNQKFRTINQSLVAYRVNTGVTSVVGRGSCTCLVRVRDAFRQALDDYKQSVWAQKDPSFYQMLHHYVDHYDSYCVLINSTKFNERWKAYWVTTRIFNTPYSRLRFAIYLFPFAIQPKLFHLLEKAHGFLKKSKANS